MFNIESLYRTIRLTVNKTTVQIRKYFSLPLACQRILRTCDRATCTSYLLPHYVTYPTRQMEGDKPVREYHMFICEEQQ